MVHDKMSLVEYAEEISPFPLSDFQKQLIERYEQESKKQAQLLSLPVKNVGRIFILEFIEEWKNKNECVNRIK